MSKSVRRIVVSLLIAAISTAAPLTAFAARAMPITEQLASESPESGMETALIAVKELFDIDDEVYTDFSYSSSSYGAESDEDVIWQFYWSDGRYAYVFAIAAADGTVLQFRRFTGDERSFGFAEISRDAAVAAADELIRQANPASFSYFKAPATVSININGSEYSLTYYAEVNDHSFAAAQISVSINKFTGEITGYSTSNIDPGRYSFGDAANLISESDAIGAYAEKIGMSLEYRSFFDYENGAIAVFPVYLLDADANKFISAVTGEVVEYVFDSGEGSVAYGFSSNASAPSPEMAADQSASGGGGRSSLSPAEISALDRVGTFITSEQALQKLLEAAELTDLDVSSFTERYIGLNRDYINRDRYFYDVNMYRYDDISLRDDEVAGLFGRVDAESGRVLSFSLNYLRAQYHEGDNEYTEEQAGEVVAAFLQTIAPEESAKTQLEHIRQSYRGEAYSFNYYRVENDIPFRDNGINIMFNQYVGRITNFSLNWHENAEFPDVGGVLPVHRALDGYVGEVGSRTNYITTGEGNAELVYEFRNRSYIDPFSGKPLDYTGKPMENTVMTPDYGDVSGHWSESVVTRLLDNGVYLWGGSFEPGRVMTELEFLRYILLIESGYGPIDPLAYLSMRGINIEVDADRALTRQEAARIVIEYLGYGKLAEQHEWFVYPFSDDVDESYRGYVTMCFMLGIVNGNNGMFNASENITRAQAAAMLHNLILARS